MADICAKILPPSNGIYQGAFVPDPATGQAETTTARSIEDFGKMSGTPLDISVKFLPFSSGLNFPSQEAKLIADNKGAIFIKLEPWSGKGPNDRSFSLKKILDGKYDHLLRRFAEGANKFGRPIFVSFGHEMNGNWYPWSKDPKLYQQAFAYVHDKISKEYGACNITWVWNPNIDLGRLDAYYPGDEYVDWVAADGYNSEDKDFGKGWRSCQDLFSGIVPQLDRFNKPLMIGEFASDANSPNDEKKRKPEWLKQCVEYFSKEKKIKAYIYFNRDKVEGGSQKKWAITTPEARAQYASAIEAKKQLFSDSIRSAHPSTLPSPKKTPKKTEVLKMPTGFDKGGISPEELIRSNKGKIGRAQNVIRKNNERIGILDKPGRYLEQRLRTNIQRSINFSEHVIQWMIERENGHDRIELLNESLKFVAVASPYRKAQVAFLLVSGNPDQQQIDYVKKLGFGIPNLGDKKLTAREKYQLILNIYNSYSKHNLQRYEPVDPLLKGEMELQLAILAPDKEKERTHRDQAEKTFDAILDNKQRRILAHNIRKRINYRKGEEARDPVEERNQVEFSIGQALALKAQILTMKAGEQDSAVESLKFLVEAYKLLKRSATSEAIKGLHFQQAKRFAAECLIQIAFILKDHEGSLRQQNALPQEVKELLTEIGNWENKINRPSNKGYLSLIHAAKVLVEGAHPESVLNWEKEYLTALESAKKEEIKKTGKSTIKPPLWPQQISIFSRLWLTKARMVVAGELMKGNPRDYIKAQLAKLREAEAELRQIKERTDLLEPESLADVKRTLAENLIRQAFILMDLGEKGYIPRLDAAGQLLADAITSGKAEVAAESRLWIAKIKLARAGKTGNRVAREKLLNEGLDEIRQALADGPDQKPLLRGVVLSSAYQTTGDLLSALKQFESAKGMFEKAIKTFDNNHEARAALGDILNWQGKHKDAIIIYNQVPKEDPAFARAQLGRREAEMRKDEAYPPEAIKNLEAEAKKIFASEAPASPLIVRALQALIEAYRTDEDLQPRIIYITMQLSREQLWGKLLSEVESSVQLDKKEKQALEDIIGKLHPSSLRSFEPKFKAEIYLRMVEALLWRKKFETVQTLISEMPEGLKQAVDSNPELQVLKGTIEAEAKMRREREAQPFTDFLAGSVHPLRIVTAEKDPDLAARLVLDEIEAHMLEKEWEKAIAAAQSPRISLPTIKGFFGDRRAAYEQFHFRFRFRLVEALIGNKDFSNAEEELNKLIKDASEMNEEHLLQLARRAQAEAYLVLGNLHSYKWKGYNYQEAKDYYLKAARLLSSQKDLSSLTDLNKASVAISGRALLGLGEIHRFGKGIKNPAEANRYYDLAEKVAGILSKRSEDRYALLAQIYLGRAKLEQQEGNQTKAIEYFEKAKGFSREVADNDDLQRSIYRTGAFLREPHVTANTEVFSDGRSAEIRTSLAVQWPLSKDRFTPYLSVNYDRGPGGVYDYSLYMGGKLRLGDFNFDLRGKLLGCNSAGKDTWYCATDHGTAGNELKYFRRYDLVSSLFYSGKYFSAGGSVSTYWSRQEMKNTAGYANLLFNLGDHVQLGAELNTYTFVFSNVPKRRDELNALLRVSFDLADLFLDQYDRAKINFHLAYPYIQYEDQFFTGQSLYDPRSLKVGAGFDIHLGKGFVLRVNCSFVNQKDYRYGTCSVGIRK